MDELSLQRSHRNTVVDPLRAELNTILAALRYYQENGQGEPANRSDAIHYIATDGGKEISLDEDGINELCERLNLGMIRLVEPLPIR
jgi:hypothetical protein